MFIPKLVGEFSVSAAQGTLPGSYGAHDEVPLSGPCRRPRGPRTPGRDLRPLWSHRAVSCSPAHFLPRLSHAVCLTSTPSFRSLFGSLSFPNVLSPKSSGVGISDVSGLITTLTHTASCPSLCN